MAFTLPIVAAKTSTPGTTIPQFLENPKTLILHHCKTTRDLNQIHAHVIKTRQHLNPIIVESLLESAAILLPQSTDYAVSIFDQIDEPNSAAYNVIIRGFILKHSPHEAIRLFKKMVECSVEPDNFTFPCILKACSRLQAVNEGEQIHAQIVKLGFWSKGFVVNSLIHMYASFGNIEVARRVFDGMSDKGIVSWNSLFSGYTKSGHWEEIVNLFREMVRLGVNFDEATLLGVLMACGRLADIGLGEWISEYVKEKGLMGNKALVTSLVDMYAKCGHIDVARRYFDQMPEKDVVAWSAMISGYSQSGNCREALDLFHEMQKANVDPSEITMVSVLSSCADLGALETGKWVHSLVQKRRLKLTVTLGTALIDFYAKCGCIENSVGVFNEMPLKNVLSWTALIQGLANNGQGKKALEFFLLMQEKNVKPSDVTFIGVLSACSHAGLVDEGQAFFVSMTRDFGIEPRLEHYGCMVDILGRAGKMEEAYRFIKNMPIEPNAVIWRTLLASCRIHKNVEIAEKSIKQLVKLEPIHSGDYILLSNVYASVGKSEDALRLRSQMKERGIKKSPGCTLIELDGEIHEILAEENRHPYAQEIYDATESMMKRIKLAGYVPNTAEARLEAVDDDRGASVSHHSEKLAIALGIIRTSPGTIIRISKNLRVCIDCHNATKFISKVFHREIVVRDRNRFHHFKDGICSCKDYW